jgi:hypothetical protein
MRSSEARPVLKAISRKLWSAPEMRRLAASSAEFGPAPTIDAEGFS